MTLDETEITRIRFEDLAPSLQELINNLASYNDEVYDTLRRNISTVADSINLNTMVYAGDENPKTISLGSTVYFNSTNNTVEIADSNGVWVYLD